MLPDEPLWVETRWMLLSGDGRLISCPPDGAIVIGSRLRTAAVIGRGFGSALRDAMAEAPSGTDLIVQEGGLGEATRALPEWNLKMATIHALPVGRRMWRTQSEVTVCAPPTAELLAELDELSAHVMPWAQHAVAVSLRRVDGEIVSVCQAIAVTEGLWDVGIDTVEGHRRDGHAIACFEALAAHMAQRGQQPSWGADDDNQASLGLARRLGFEPVGRMGVLEPPHAEKA